MLSFISTAVASLCPRSPYVDDTYPMPWTDDGRGAIRHDVQAGLEVRYTPRPDGPDYSYQAYIDGEPVAPARTTQYAAMVDANAAQRATIARDLTPEDVRHA